jgi:hypothetical protein
MLSLLSNVARLDSHLREEVGEVRELPASQEQVQVQLRVYEALSFSTV